MENQPEEEDNFFLTTPIYYTNGSPHIGHVYTTVVASAYAEFFRFHYNSPILLTGTDEHGEKIEKKAKSQNLSPIELADLYSKEFKNLWQRLWIKNDHFVRTTSEDHKKIVIEKWNHCIKNDDIYLSEFKGLYCVGCESFKTDKDLVDGKCPDHLVEPKEVSEKCYFFRLTKYESKLKEFINNNPDFIYPKSRRNEVISFLESNELKDIPVSRSSFKWGIPVPNDNDHVIYVWFDALISYLSHNEANENTVHFIAKDILKFHAIYWPCFLFAFGLPLPKKLFVHSFILNKGQKTGKSLIEAGKQSALNINELVDKHGINSTEALRLYLLSSFQTDKDGEFSLDALVDVYNKNIVNLGNLYQRCLHFIHNETTNLDLSKFTEIQKGFQSKINALYEKGIESWRTFNHQEGIQCAFEIIQAGNKFFNDNKPWTFKDNYNEFVESIVTLTLEAVARATYLLVPALPYSAPFVLGLLHLNNHRFPLPRSFFVYNREVLKSEKPLFSRITN